jgi:DNA repair protein RadC
MYKETTFPIKLWAEDDRPREKLLLKGANNLSNAELLAILLNSGHKNKSALDLAKELLSLSKNNLNEFSKISYHDLCKVKGIGDAKALTILALLEFSKRKSSEESIRKTKITASLEIFNLLKEKYENLEHEEFYVIYLNRANEIISIKQLSKGGITGTVVDARLIFKFGINFLASGIILTHNHPSGQLKPSEEDLKLTKKIKVIGNLMGILVLDHLIFGDNAYFSFADEGLI